MKNSAFHSHTLTLQEKRYGTRYLLFETVFLASILQSLNILLPTPLSQVQINFLFFCINFGAVAVIFRKYLLAQARLVPDLIWKILSIAGAGFVAYWLLNILLTRVLLALDPGFASVNDVTVQRLVREDFFLMFLGSVILVPITEECLFRGLVFRGIYDRSRTLAWVISVALFAAVHVTGYVGAYPFWKLVLCFVQYIPAGICLAGAYRLSGSLLSPILIHALVNFVGMLALR